MTRPPAVLDVFSVIGHPRRRAIMNALAGEGRVVSELVDEVGVSQPTVSEHLAQLRQVGLVTCTKSGRERLYRLDTAPLQDITEWIATLEAFWDERFERLGRTLAAMDKERDL
ncbi:ArsR/SmtB family transcription factor [Brevibacterium aurantiacum]|uniref:ArsR/SmtB family transcription factor n=1 Tax=Brevibacterium aurantiacum TaxID=273384 RepID=UPI0018683A75|nr:metalloregulator ArsR/SmtB family transcription factor [Brevibacterium aurantiacum]